MIGLDDLLGTLHQDRTTRFRDQLWRVEREINTRRLVSAEHTVNLYEQITTLTVEILRLQPEHDGAVDPHRVIRQGLERERRLLAKEITEEVRNRWRDSQDLVRERRALLDALAEEHRRYERNVRDYAA